MNKSTSNRLKVNKDIINFLMFFAVACFLYIVIMTLDYLELT